MLKYTYDEEADAAYILLSDAPFAYGQDLDCSRRIDFSSDRKPIGIELLNVSQGVQLADLPAEQEVGVVLKAHNVQILTPR